MTPPRAPPPRGGCCYSQPESLGEGEEAAAAASAICRGEVGCEEAARQGLRDCPPSFPGECRGLGVMDVFLR